MRTEAFLKRLAREVTVRREGRLEQQASRKDPQGVP
jgi:hypothetical protein